MDDVIKILINKTKYNILKPCDADEKKSTLERSDTLTLFDFC